MPRTRAHSERAEHGFTPVGEPLHIVRETVEVDTEEGRRVRRVQEIGAVRLGVAGEPSPEMGAVEVKAFYEPFDEPRVIREDYLNEPELPFAGDAA